MNKIFDYVIVGAGSAGCVLANRLSEDADVSVCLLEAGPEGNTPMVSTPGAFAYFMFSKKYNWRFEGKPQPDIREGKPIFSPRGKLLGGSSSVNGMVYIRGDRSDYDAWAAAGNPGWSFDDVLPYFKRAENNERGADHYHGDSGPMHVTNCQPAYQLSEAFVDAAREAGFPINDDFNGKALEGVGTYQFTIKDGQRCGAVRAYLKPARERPNLTVLTEAPASRILFDGKRATGVAIRHQGQEQHILAAREVLLSSGALNSPQLLLLSGVGPAAGLAPHGIRQIHELPGVGGNLQEHVDACVLTLSRKRDGFTVSPGGLAKMAPELLRYLKDRSGKLANSITETGGFIKSRPDVDVPDVQLHFVPLMFDDSGRNLKLMSTHGYSCHACVLRPKSRGSVSLASANPSSDPIIDFDFLDHPDDRKTLVDGIRRVREILEAPAFDAWRGDEFAPGVAARTDEEILAACKKHLGIVYHPVGTCKMGHDEMAVVDSELRVHGLTGLRVIDASIMPTLISGNTNAPTIMIAEKAADLIRGERLAKEEGSQTTVAEAVF